jgi:hypothetical protein
MDLPAGRVEVWDTTPDVFATDREITQAEYDEIRGFLQRQHDELSHSFEVTQ